MTIRNIVALSVALLSAAAAVAGNPVPNPETSRPLQDRRYIVGLVPHEEGFDAFWVHEDEFAAPLRTRLLRTEITAEGLLRGSAALIRDHQGPSSTKVDGLGPVPQALWTADRTLLASPILNGVLKFPEGKFVAAFADYPRLACDRSQCVASWQSGGARMAVVLDGDSNPSSALFFLPDGWEPMSLTLDESGIFYVRHTLGEVRAALITHDGVTQYDVTVTRTVTLTVNPTPMAVAFDGSRHVVVFLERSTEWAEVRAVAISPSGSVSPPVTLLRDDSRVDLGSLAIAWNGTSYLLAGGYMSSLRTSFVSRFDADLLSLDPGPRPAGVAIGSPRIRVVGTSFAIGWNGLRPYVTVVSADGRISLPVAIDALGRRRGAMRR